MDVSYMNTLKNKPVQISKYPKVKGILLIVILVFVDQLTKYLAIHSLRDGSRIVLIKNVLKLRYLENRGMAFGLLQGKIPLLIAICILFFAAIVYLFIKIPPNAYYLPLLYTSAVVFSGAVGNFIDRVWRGYVVDFIYFSLIDFPTFNIADIYVTCGIAVLVFLLFFRYKNDNDFDFLNPKNSR